MGGDIFGIRTRIGQVVTSAEALELLGGAPGLSLQGQQTSQALTFRPG